VVIVNVVVVLCLLTIRSCFGKYNINQIIFEEISNLICFLERKREREREKERERREKGREKKRVKEREKKIDFAEIRVSNGPNFYVIHNFTNNFRFIRSED